MNCCNCDNKLDWNFSLKGSGNCPSCDEKILISPKSAMALTAFMIVVFTFIPFGLAVKGFLAFLGAIAYLRLSPTIIDKNN
ncbi:hypothetical protein R50072_26940 [Simiduia litorea]|uniref:hypothetical protein n=1 Tax=Simiduia litorea TaxID=1435348 RepID=UPI0036F341BC